MCHLRMARLRSTMTTIRKIVFVGAKPALRPCFRVREASDDIKNRHAWGCIPGIFVAVVAVSAFRVSATWKQQQGDAGLPSCKLFRVSLPLTGEQEPHITFHEDM